MEKPSKVRRSRRHRQKTYLFDDGSRKSVSRNFAERADAVEGAAAAARRQANLDSSAKDPALGIHPMPPRGGQTPPTSRDYHIDPAGIFTFGDIIAASPEATAFFAARS